MNREDEILQEMNLLREEYKFITGAYDSYDEDVDYDYYEEDVDYDYYEEDADYDFYDEDVDYDYYEEDADYDYYEEDAEYWNEEAEEKAPSKLKTFFQNQLQKFQRLKEELPGKIDSMIKRAKDALVNAPSNAKNAIKSIGSGIASLGRGLMSLVSNLIKLCASAIKKDEAGMAKAKAELSRLGQKLKDGLNQLTGYKEKLRKFYEGRADKNYAKAKEKDGEARGANLYNGAFKAKAMNAENDGDAKTAKMYNKKAAKYYSAQQKANRDSAKYAQRGADNLKKAGKYRY